MDHISPFVPYLMWGVPILVLLLSYKLVLRIFGIIIIAEDEMGEVNKQWALFGHTTLPDGAIIALQNEAGWQADTLAPGLHFGYWPWQYEVKREPFTLVQQGSVGVVEARDGNPLSDGHVLAEKVECNSFQDARMFLQNGGGRGPQIAIVPQGTYRINKMLFSVKDEPVKDIGDNMVGIVTTKDGKPLPRGEIAGPEVPGHNLFQDGQTFINAGGYRGLQEQVMLAGRYFLNPCFVTVEPVPMYEVPIAHVGVVIAYVGSAGVDVTGVTFTHGNIVSKGQKGVWDDPLDPGKYPINPKTHKVEDVPTANVVLNWATGKTESHKLDEHLSTIKLRSSDGFDYTMDVSQIIHVPRNHAPLVIARFGSMSNLVTQVLEPTIGNYFRNAAQGSDVIDFLTNRAERQREASEAIRAALREYNVEAVNTLIGDIVPPPELMRILTDRKLAEQEKKTYQIQQEAQENRQKLEQATALANTQARVVDAERQVQIAEFTAQAVVKTAAGSAESKTINAEADAGVITLLGNAEAGKITAVGSAEADVIKLKIASIEPENYARIEVARALSTSGFKLVPEVVAGGNGDNGGNTLVNVLMAGMIRDRMNSQNGTSAPVATHTDVAIADESAH